MLLKIALKCVSNWVVLDLPNQKIWTLTPCDRFTAECGSPVMLKSMSSSLIARLNSLSVLNDAMSRLSSGTNCSFTVCTWAVTLNKLPCSIVSMLHTDVFRQSLRFPRFIWRTKFFVQTLIIDLVGTGRFTFNNKHIFCVLRFHRSITDWFGFWLGWSGERCMLNFSTRLLNEFTDWLLFNPIHHSLWSNRDRVYMRSLVVVEEILL